jgi:mannitol-1-phosphate 5-dehydrogenase
VKAVHFGAGNIGRGFIGEVLFKNNFHIDFVDVNETIINELHTRKGYTIELAGAAKKSIAVNNVDGINSKTDGPKVIEAIAAADLVTTAIGPKILPFIAELIAQGIAVRRGNNNTKTFDIIACENMIGGTAFLFSEVQKYLSPEDISFVKQYAGFPNAAVDRIVPVQHHDDPLQVSVEPFKEWVIDDSQRKAKHINLSEVEYVSDLQPYIERKLFSVNTGHATIAYTGYHHNCNTIYEAMSNDAVMSQLKNVLAETSALLIDKWHFDKATHQKYVDTIITRFSNKYISDDIPRVAREPLRKLSFNERFIRPLRELKERALPYKALLSTIKLVLQYNNEDDPESVELQKIIKNNTAPDAIKKITALTDETLIKEIVALLKE